MTVANAAIASFDDVMLSQLDTVVYLVNYAACRHVDLAMQSLDLLKRLSSSRKLTGIIDTMSGQRIGNRLVGRIQEATDIIAIELRRDFEVDIMDLESETQPLKLAKAQKILGLLNSAIDASPNKPNIAHSLLGLLEGQGRNVSWLLSTKRGCLELITKLATATLSSSLVQNELRSMDFLPALAMRLLETRADVVWDSVSLQSTDILLQSAGCGIRDFMRIREAWFEYAGLELRSVAAC
ncbi:hypothetical protein L1887_62997 [Cichorium endivia]|nr:hypothetical protein L1887_62997 [Cichorium endivia]